ncbi:MAG: hypothetical protein K6E28_11195 [Eubacterium sp.]|nr:hypothetical protein [Eubacterium sp.]
MEKLKVTYDEADKTYAVIEAMDYEAGVYCPSISDLKKMVKDLGKYYKFLSWIDETGTVLPENEKAHQIIRAILKEYVEEVEE